MDPDASFSLQLRGALDRESNIELIGCAEDGELAVELASDRGAEVVILAVELPDAVDVVRRLTGLTPKAPKVILMSNENLDPELLEATGDIAGFVRKTNELSEMVTLIVAVTALANVRSGTLNGSAH